MIKDSDTAIRSVQGNMKEIKLAVTQVTTAKEYEKGLSSGENSDVDEDDLGVSQGGASSSSSSVVGDSGVSSVTSRFDSMRITAP